MSRASNGIDVKRLKKELIETQRSPDKPVCAQLVTDGDYFNWTGEVKGPQDSPYENGIFRVIIGIPPEYPYKPPKMRFGVKLWHPNVSSQTGAICLDVLGKEWSPALTIRTVLLSLQALLATPEPDDPQDAVVAEMYKANFPEFERKAKEWTKIFAHGREETEEEKVKKLVSFLDVGEERARKALEKHQWNEMAAISSIDFDEDVKPEPTPTPAEPQRQPGCGCCLQ
jgi:ubiquitin-conjugating enzyme (huntingtin interacting protein 2)